MSVFNHVGLCVTDVGRSRRFYEELLGFTYLRELQPPDEFTGRLMGVEPPVGLTAVYLQRDGFVLELLHYARPGNAPRRDRSLTEPGLTHVSLSVENMTDVCARVPDFGGEVLAETDLGGMAIMIRDPDGQLIELLPMSYRENVQPA